MKWTKDRIKNGWICNWVGVKNSTVEQAYSLQSYANTISTNEVYLRWTSFTHLQMFWKISLSPTYLMSTYCGPGITSGTKESVLNKSDPPDQSSNEIYTCRRTQAKNK